MMKKLVIKIIAIFLLFLITSGLIIFFMGTLLDSEEFLVVDVKNDKIIIDTKDLFHGENKELSKPFFVNLKKGDKVYVRYDIKNPNKMMVVINPHIGEIMFSLGIFIIDLITFFAISSMIVKYIIDNNYKK